MSVNPLRLIKVRLVLLGIGKILSSHFCEISSPPTYSLSAAKSFLPSPHLFYLLARYFSPGNVPYGEKGTFRRRV